MWQEKKKTKQWNGQLQMNICMKTQREKVPLFELKMIEALQCMRI